MSSYVSGTNIAPELDRSPDLEEALQMAYLLSARASQSVPLLARCGGGGSEGPVVKA